MLQDEQRLAGAGMADAQQAAGAARHLRRVSSRGSIGLWEGSFDWGRPASAQGVCPPGPWTPSKGAQLFASLCLSDHTKFYGCSMLSGLLLRAQA